MKCAYMQDVQECAYINFKAYQIFKIFVQCPAVSRHAIMETTTLQRVPSIPTELYKTPEKSMPRKGYEETLTKTRVQIGDHNVWVPVDRATDANSQYVDNVAIRHLELDKPAIPILLNAVFSKN